MWEEAIDNNLGIVRRIQGWGWIGWHREVIPWYFDVSRAKSWEVLFVGAEVVKYSRVHRCRSFGIGRIGRSCSI